MAETPLDDAASDLPLIPPVQPNPGVPKTIGILNIVFGSALLLCGICTGFYAIILSSMGPMLAAQNQQVRKAVEAEYQAELKKLQDKEAAATDEEEKAAAQAEIKALKARPTPPIPDTSKMLDSPGMQVYMLADAFTGIVVNVLLLVTGIGLLALKEWARVLALWVAVLKIIRLVAIYGFWIPLAVAPQFAVQMRAMFDEGEVGQAAPAGTKGPSPEELAQMTKTMAVMWTGYALGFMVVGAIYPVVLLILLTRPRVKAAFAVPLPEIEDQGLHGP